MFKRMPLPLVSHDSFIFDQLSASCPLPIGKTLEGSVGKAIEHLHIATSFFLEQEENIRFVSLNLDDKKSLALFFKHLRGRFCIPKKTPEGVSRTLIHSVWATEVASMATKKYFQHFFFRDVSQVLKVPELAKPLAGMVSVLIVGGLGNVDTIASKIGDIGSVAK